MYHGGTEVKREALPDRVLLEEIHQAVVTPTFPTEVFDAILSDGVYRTFALPMNSYVCSELELERRGPIITVKLLQNGQIMGRIATIRRGEGWLMKLR